MGKNIVENYKNLSDNELIALIKQGDFKPLGIIIDRYYPAICNYVNQFCPENCREDAIQEATFALYGSIKGYCSEKSLFSTYANLCIKRSVISYLKTQNRKKAIPSALLSSIDEVDLADCNSPEKIFFERNDYEALTDTIRLELSKLEYEVLQLYISGYKYSVIAEKLSITEKSVNNALLRIRKKLKQQ